MGTCLPEFTNENYHAIMDALVWLEESINHGYKCNNEEQEWLDTAMELMKPEANAIITSVGDDDPPF